MVAVWAFASGGTGCPCRCGARRGLALSSPDLTAVSLFYAPYPPYPPSPAGKGEPQSLFRRGLRPRHPGAEPLTALTDIAVPVPYVGKPAVRRKSEGKRLPIVSPEPRPVQPRGCKGRSPLHKITLSLPLPGGKGVGGMGAGKQAKVKRQAGNKEGKPPAGYHSGKVGRRQRRQAPRRHWLAQPRGRGPSQTPPSLATDSSISPGPPSPWLPALPIERLFYRFFA